jgi:hypothetical protein
MGNLSADKIEVIGLQPFPTSVGIELLHYIYVGKYYILY